MLEVVYLIFNEGKSATAGDDWMRPSLCAEALRLGRILAELAPGELEVHGLISLMEIQASRAGARIGPSGEPVRLLDQDRARWDHLLVRRGLAALERAELGPSGEPVRLLDQDRARWDHLLVRRGLAALERAELGASAKRPKNWAARRG